MHKVNVKTLSVNDAWKGRRFKTKKYEDYEWELYSKLPKIKVPKNKQLFLEIEVGYSSKASDLDNCLKPFIDILQKKYEFDDKWIYGFSVHKKDVKKGEEYIAFSLEELIDMDQLIKDTQPNVI